MANSVKKKNTLPKKKKVNEQFSKIKQDLSVKKKDIAQKVETNIKGKNRDGSPKKPKKKRHILLIAFMTLMIIGALSCLAFAIYIIIEAPEFDVKELFRPNSTIIYDMNGDVIAEIGTERREDVTYDELPEVLVDAIVATEDSKFFQHGGIDLLRFGKAALGQLLGHSDAGGGSTLTMQLSKNTYMGTESHGIKGIIRKFSDIYMAVFKIEKTYTKQEILEFYVNQGLLGGSNYGVSQASQVYFGKDVSQLNLSEAALIAGLFQAPNAYYPFKYPEKAQSRRDLVLNLMVRHGYITEEEASVAKSIKVEDMLVEQKDNASIKYPGFVDTVVAEVMRRTKQDPYEVSMRIYTTLDPERQKVIDQLYDGTLYKWKNDVVQFGVAVTDVHTGAVVAIGNGRNRNGAKLLNYATDIKRHPGSTAKPIFDYGPAIEYAGWGTGTIIVDDVYTYSNGTSINNVDRGYKGLMTAKTALANSRNIPALQAFQATSQEDKYEFVTNLGMTPEIRNGEMLESTSIGAYEGSNPLQMSAAYAAFSRGGYYIEPYTITKVEFNDKTTYNHTPTRTKAMSEETAFMVNMMLKYAVTSGAIGVGNVSGTDLASKTGTSSEDSAKIKQLHLASNTIKDSWQVAYSPDYSIAFWYGYDQNTKEHYLTSTEGWNARRAIVRALTPRIMKKNSRWTKPSGVIAVDIELETIPGQSMLASEYTPSNLRSTEYYKKGTEPTEVSTRFSALSDVSNLTYTTVGNQVQLSWSPIETPDAIDANYLKNYFDTNYSRWADKYYNKRLEYNAANIGNLVYEVFMKTDSGLLSLGTTSSSSFTTTVTNSSTVTFVVKSTYSIFRANASPGREVTVKFNSIVTPPTTGDDDDDNGDNNPSQEN